MSSIAPHSCRIQKGEIYQSEQQCRETRSHSPATCSLSESGDALRKTLAKLAHLDLTRHVQHDGTVMKAHGGYCDVFMGSVSTSSPSSFPWGWPRVMKVAIKRLRVHIQSDRDFAKLLAKELHVWSKLDHVNILPLVGYVLEGDYPSVVSEWIENGTVGRYMKENPDADIEPLIMGIANGVEYLHRQNIVHSDLKADNVLVSRFGEPLICDFGISRMLASSLSIAGTSTGGLKGSVRWMAFELLDITGDACHTKETDVWAYGMTVYEILTKDIPYIRLKHDVLVMFAILQGELPSAPPNFDDWSSSIQFIWKICEECWVTPAECRITMEQVVTSLSGGNTMDKSPVQPVSPPPAPKAEEWDDTYLVVLSTQDLKQLQELLARSNPKIIMPSNGPGPLSQAVILTLVHRLASAIRETSPVEKAFKSSLWWLQRASTTLNTNDPFISPYAGRILPNVSQMLNTTKQRLSLLPSVPQLVYTTRLISDIQETLKRKPL